MVIPMLKTWTTTDFEELCWHDCHIHGFRFGDVNEEYGTADLEFDIDFITEWIAKDGSPFQFLVAPATLTFHDAISLRFELDYVTSTAGMTVFSIDGIYREPFPPPADMIFHWRLPINWPAGEITFDSPGFTQRLSQEPVHCDGQRLTEEQRRN